MSAQRWASALCVDLHREKLLSLPGPGGVSLHPTSQCSDREWSGPVKREGGRQSVRAITEPHTPGDQLHSQSVQRPRAWHEHHRSLFTPPWSCSTTSTSTPRTVQQVRGGPTLRDICVLFRVDSLRVTQAEFC